MIDTSLLPGSKLRDLERYADLVAAYDDLCDEDLDRCHRHTENLGFDDAKVERDAQAWRDLREAESRPDPLADHQAKIKAAQDELVAFRDEAHKQRVALEERERELERKIALLANARPANARKALARRAEAIGQVPQVPSANRQAIGSVQAVREFAATVVAKAGRPPVIDLASLTSNHAVRREFEVQGYKQIAGSQYFERMD